MIVQVRMFDVKSPRDFYMERLALAYCIDNDISVNFGLVIVERMKYYLKSRNFGSIIFLTLITRACVAAGVHLKRTPLIGDWVCHHSALDMYVGYDHKDYVSEGEGPDLVVEKKRNKRRNTGSSGVGSTSSSGVPFVAMEDEPMDSDGFMARYYMDQRDMRGFMAESRQFYADSRARWADEDADDDDDDDDDMEG